MKKEHEIKLVLKWVCLDGCMVLSWKKGELLVLESSEFDYQEGRLRWFGHVECKDDVHWIWRWMLMEQDKEVIRGRLGRTVSRRVWKVWTCFRRMQTTTMTTTTFSAFGVSAIMCYINRPFTYARLTAIFQDNLGEPVPGCLHSGFYWS